MTNPITLSPATLRAVVSMLRDARPYLKEHGSEHALELLEQMHLMAVRLDNEHLKPQRRMA
jgi:hypothetical protein